MILISIINFSGDVRLVLVDPELTKYLKISLLEVNYQDNVMYV
jgi:hypothetical protein